MKPLKLILLLCLALSVEGRAGFVSATAGVLDFASDNLTQRNPVTGIVAVNTVSLEKEIELGKGYEKQIMEGMRKQGVQFDTSPTAQERIGKVINALIPVCHLPKFPWRYHYTTSMEWNAFAVPGGSIFVNEGLLRTVNDTELAAVLGHELAHVTCRHIAERQGQMMGTSLFSQEARTSQFYKANFSTVQENQADQVGLMYMAAAGYDPTQTSLLWDKMYKQYGSSNNGYMSDHGLNYERAARTRQLGQEDLKYYKGPGVVNPNPDYLKSLELGKNDNKILNLITAGIVLSRQHDQTHAEAEQRQRYSEVLGRIKFVSLTSKRPLFSKVVYWEGVIQNTNNASIPKVIMELYYLDANGKQLRTEAWGIDNLKAGETRTYSGVLKANPGERFSGQLTQVEL
jgi:predicted Zn-dependent protease